jgi:hypothetical protein
VVAYLALFALGGGTAVALSGANTVQSEDLGPRLPGEGPDVADNAVGSPDVIRNSLTGALPIQAVSSGLEPRSERRCPRAESHS